MSAAPAYPDGLYWAPCPICGGPPSRTVHTEPMGELSSPLTGRFPADLPMHVVACAQCGFWYANPRPTQEVLDARYQHMSDIEYNLSGQQSRVRVFEHVIGYLMRSHPVPGRILDVGCFTGTLLEVAAKRGWEPWGVELNKVASGYARDDLGYQVHTGLLRDAHLQGDFFDAVAATDTIEHLIDPKESLQEIFRILKPGGHMVLTVPNARMQIPKENWKKRLGRGRGVVIGGMGHINHFTPQSMPKVLRGIGFAGVRIHCSIPEGQQSAKVDRAKRAYVAVAESIRRATGLNIGHEMLVLARKP